MRRELFRGCVAGIPRLRSLHLTLYIAGLFSSKVDLGSVLQRSGIIVKMIRLRSIALTSLCLLLAQFLSFAQTTGTPPQDAQKPAAAQVQQTPPASQDKSQRGAQNPPAELPNAPPSQTEPSLNDLGFSPSQTQADVARQALLDKRTHMLKIHQRLGLIAAVPVLATVITSVGAGGKSTSTSSRDLHAALGGLAGDLYFSSAYFAIRAPKIPGTETRGPIRLHKALAWIHGPGMIATPILGIMAFDQKSKGEKVHGIASAHGPVAIVTAGAFGAALLSVSVKF